MNLQVLLRKSVDKSNDMVNAFCLVLAAVAVVVALHVGICFDWHMYTDTFWSASLQKFNQVCETLRSSDLRDKPVKSQGPASGQQLSVLCFPAQVPGKKLKTHLQAKAPIPLLCLLCSQVK